MDQGNLTLEERLKMKKSGFAKTLRSGANSGDGSDEETFGSVTNTTKRLNKNCPSEVTSKRPVGRFREALQIRKKVTRDPRFDSASGKLNEDLFKKSYAFLDEYKVCIELQ